MKPASLQIEDVSKSYRNQNGELVALSSCSIEIAPEELHVIVGPSGCGKTTLLNAVAGFQGIDGGVIRLGGETLCTAERAAEPGADRVVVFQHSTLFPWRTVLDNVTYGPVIQGRRSRAEARSLALERLSQAGLTGVEDRYPAELSSGAQRRVEIVRALVNEPRVLLLDEPFRGMDQITRDLMHEALLELYDRARPTVLFITHDIEEAVFLGSRVTAMSARPGRVKATIEVDLPRPREADLRASARFNELLADVLSLVHDEASQAFVAGDREAA